MRFERQLSAAVAGLLAVLVFACPLLGRADEASADPIPRPTSAEALRYLDEGYRYYELGDFEKAIEIYTKGALIEPGPSFHFNLGQCYRRLREYRKAIFHFERVLANRAVKPEVRQHLEKFIRDMRAELEHAASTAPPTETAESIGSNSDIEPGSSAEPVSLTAAVPREHWYHDSLGWTVGGTGVALLIVGGVLHMRGAGLDERAIGQPQAEYLRLTDSADDHRAWGTGSLIVGGLAAAIGIVRLALDPDSPDIRQSASEMSLEVRPSTLGVVFSF